MPKAASFFRSPFPPSNIQRLDLRLDTFNFPPSQRIRRSEEFRRIRHGGRRFSTEHFTLFVAIGNGIESRLGLTVSRKVGGAVVRNKVKRRVREFFRTRRHLFPIGIDLSVIARSPWFDLSQTQLERELMAALVTYVRAGK